MTYDFTRTLIETVRVDAERRARGKLGRFRRILGGGGPVDGFANQSVTRGYRFTERAIISAVSESPERFSQAERERFLASGELPGWFWPWVEERARYWDAETV
jgi:hypothetical protein